MDKIYSIAVVFTIFVAVISAWVLIFNEACIKIITQHLTCVALLSSLSLGSFIFVKRV